MLFTKILAAALVVMASGLGHAQQLSFATRPFRAVPTTAEAGFPHARSSIWFGMCAPASTPPALVESISRDVAAIVRRADFADKQVGVRPE